ncbi:DNA polymerase delta catalytic subunit [Sitophilus oryzae]|uniref:DNA polymerase n=1 Tax=Sitophilus oryzae TaxID=7048 RepID=A0A6J2YT75_SITOR|nr:DNA polymerase delta catalytic subunit [Sitophilus oryzae]
MNKRKSDEYTGHFKKYKPNGTTVLYQRPPILHIDPAKDTFIFQELELDNYVGNVYPGMPGPQSGPVPIIRMFGITKEGNSVCCHVHGFSPYFYINLPTTFSNGDLGPFKDKLNEALINDIRGGNRDGITDAVLIVEIIKGKNLVEYHGDDDEPFAKITLSQHKFVPAAKRLLSTQIIYQSLSNHNFQFFESNVDIETRFMVDTNILGCCWIELPPKTWYERTDFSAHSKTSRCQIEVDVAWDNFISHAPEGEWGDVAQFRIHSFDIECAGRKGIFPEPKIDPIIQIANVIQLHGVKEVMARNIFCLKSCAPIGHAEVYCYEDESKMLEAWAQFVRELDPDIFTGYNINNFDFPYLLERAKHLKVQNFDFLGRLLNVRSQIKETTTQTKIGKRMYKTINFEGRVPYDMLLVIKRDFKLRSYTLNSVCQEILGEQKEDVHYSIITDLQNGDEQTRRRLAVYCLKDADLPLRLINTVLSFTNDVEMARVTGVPITSLLTKGEQVKVVAQLLRHAREAGYFMPAHQGTPAQEQYEGATVIEPARGYYTDPIATLDFSSLYPSIMIAHNLCYTTLIKSTIMKDKLGLTNDQVTSTPVNSLFVKSSVRPGLLPHILQHLLAARKKTKALLKDAKDPVLKAVLNGRQLAYKISANSVYGFTGAQVGKLPCLEISGSVTAYGRAMIEQTKQEVEQHYTIQNGYETDAKVIYGDTDSVMVNFKVKTLERSMELGKEAAELISTKFISPIKLEFEKVYYPYLLINKKRYAGLYFTKPDKYDKMDCKGIETVRRDNCTLVVDVIGTCLQKLLIDRDPDGAVNYAKLVISDLLQNNIDISQLVITKELSKEDYAAKQAHVELAKKMKKRDPGNAPKIGDRIPYVITAGNRNAKAFEKAEDPIYVLENNIPIDARYYLENQLSKPLVRIFQPILGDNAESILLRGEHTRTRTVVTSKVGALSAFTQKKETCLGCKSVLPKGYENEAVCAHCKPKEASIFQQELCHHRMLEDRFSELFTECQRCQGSLHEEILCTSRDCPIFYIRKKVQMELDNSKKKVARFGDPLAVEEDESSNQDIF